MRTDAPRVPLLLVLTGASAAGKSTVAQRICEQLPCSVHLRGDGFRRNIVNGRVDVTDTPTPAAFAQLRLRYRIAADAARAYLAEGFTVVWQDVIVGPMLAEALAPVRDLPLHLVVLCPSVATIAQREAARSKRAYSGTSTLAALDAIVREATPRWGLWLDSSAQDADETATQILRRLAEARLSPT